MAEARRTRGSFRNERVVIVGGSSGIGLAVAEAVLAEGGGVILVGRSDDRLRKAAAHLDPLGSCRTVVCDVSEEDQVARLADETGPIDHVVVTAAGNIVYKPFSDVSAAEARRVLDAKVMGAFFLAKYMRPFLAQTGSIVFTGGINAYIPPGRSAIVSAANGALEALARALAIELKPVRVNVVSPGWVDTPIWSAIAEEEQKGQMVRDLAARLPAGRIGRPEDIADAILLLLTNGYITGTVLNVDGGRRLL